MKLSKIARIEIGLCLMTLILGALALLVGHIATLPFRSGPLVGVPYALGFFTCMIVLLLGLGIHSIAGFYSNQLRMTEDFQRGCKEIEGFLAGYFLKSMPEPGQSGSVKLTRSGALLFRANAAHPKERWKDRWINARHILEDGPALKARIKSDLKAHMGALRALALRLHDLEFSIPELSNHQRLEALRKARMTT